MDEWDSTPRIAFLSPEPGSGKSRALEVTEPLVPRPVHAVNVSASYLFRTVRHEDGAPTILYDETDTVFGPKAKENEDIRGLLNAGHRKGATAGRCEIRGKKVITVDYPAYCAVALAGLDDLPDTLMTRSVVVRMRRRAPNEQHRALAPPAQRRPRARSWATGSASGRTPASHLDHVARHARGIEDRNADVWEALLAVADLAGGEWPERARRCAVSLVTQALATGGSLGVTLLRDLRAIFSDVEQTLDRDHPGAAARAGRVPLGGHARQGTRRPQPRPAGSEVRRQAQGAQGWGADLRGLRGRRPGRPVESLPHRAGSRPRLPRNP